MPLALVPKIEGYDILLPRRSANSFLGETLASNATDDQRIKAGFFKVIPGEPLVHTYDADEFKIITEVHNGTFHLSDETGQAIEAQVGDVILLDKGATITFEVKGGEDAYAHAFWVIRKA
ncbi:hypothetical protein BN7_3266 [Wickerhamomyces ciferrii]|uniref:(S)-ureidoglycine aminohydrolase cupin domain-containing protein n=1 Tax=Wickerhamomyces ciferrii (strain ATCC 14091 / BCRC 22168 / CBS 111 / JCM 3599 / NBRC 0793 / NRRL Y-1031 F-60-10) TaxID=1206466 RepID=K0KNF4_WICCF|nr:uncharacterized protein BN7_3266 [Wickerhamomyces ciferrii]CCH43712.1 hypothetical protein BN7_3266 [Wickerhamomyces ciferrii]